MYQGLIASLSVWYSSALMQPWGFNLKDVEIRERRLGHKEITQTIKHTVMQQNSTTHFVYSLCMHNHCISSAYTFNHTVFQMNETVLEKYLLLYNSYTSF